MPKSVRRAIRRRSRRGPLQLRHRLLTRRWAYQNGSKARGVAQCDADGRPRHVLRTSQDVTVQRLADEGTEHRGERDFETSLQRRRDHRRRRGSSKTNDSFSRILGYPAEEMLSRRRTSSAPPPDQFLRMWRALGLGRRMAGRDLGPPRDGEIVRCGRQ